VLLAGAVKSPGEMVSPSGQHKKAKTDILDAEDNTGLDLMKPGYLNAAMGVLFTGFYCIALQL